MTINEILRKQRIRKGLTQRQVADKLGLESTQFVSLMERGESHVPITTLGKLLQMLELDEKELIRILVADFRLHATNEITKGKIAATKGKV